MNHHSNPDRSFVWASAALISDRVPQPTVKPALTSLPTPRPLPGRSAASRTRHADVRLPLASR